MGSADASSSIIGRHRNITQLATNKEIGELRRKKRKKTHDH